MPLVGDLLLDVRRRIPDLPSALAAPLDYTIGSSASGGTLPAGTYYCVVSALNQFGETLATTEHNSGALVGSTNQVTAACTVAQLPLGASILRAYFGFGAGLEYGFIQSTITAGSPLTLTLKNISDLIPGIPPTRATAFLPDSDGGFVSAQGMYSLLNRSLSEMVRIAGGITDVTGVQTVINTSMYRLASPFYQFVNAWFDGYPMDVVPRDLMFLRNSAAGFSGILSYEQDGPQSVIQVWPQSNRTGGSNTLASPMTATSSSFTVNDATGFLSIGIAQVDSELMVYSNVSANQFIGVLRGVGGTDITAHSAAAPVTEMNLRLSGRRMPRAYNSGDALLTIAVPQAWETVLPLHMLGQIRSMEQDEAGAKELLAEFQAQADKIGKASRLGQIKPRQVAVWGDSNRDVRNVHVWGWLVG